MYCLIFFLCILNFKPNFWWRNSWQLRYTISSLLSNVHVLYILSPYTHSTSINTPFPSSSSSISFMAFLALNHFKISISQGIVLHTTIPPAPPYSYQLVADLLERALKAFPLPTAVLQQLRQVEQWPTI